ncbi:MAG: chromosomal replication initiator protein DnaA [Actinomycetota bacterium]
MEKVSQATGVDPTEAWTRALERIRRDLAESSYKMWFSEVEARALPEGVLELVAPSEYVKSWLAHHYMDLITKAVREAGGRELAIRLTNRDRADQAGPAPAPAKSVTESPAAEPPQRDVSGPPGSEVGGTFSERYTFETFVLGPSNRFAHAATMAVAEAAPSKAYNPLFIYGGVGLGKTHLLYAIASHMLRMSPQLRVKYVTSEAFVTEFIRAIREGKGYTFQRRYRDNDVLLVDDIQFLAGKEETQTEFFHTFNDLHRSERQIVIASDRPPQDLAGLEDRLRNRFRWGLCVDIQPPDLETRIAILQMKAIRDSLAVPDKVTTFIAEKFDSNIRELEGALLRVAAFASLSRLPIDVSLAERALEDLLPQGSQEISSDTIMDETATYFGLGREDLVSKSRSRPLTTARHIAMYLLRELTGLSLIKIGELFDRDHSTALHGIQKIEGQMPVRGSTYKQVQDLTKKIKTAARTLR